MYLKAHVVERQRIAETLGQILDLQNDGTRLDFPEALCDGLRLIAVTERAHVAPPSTAGFAS